MKIKKIILLSLAIILSLSIVLGIVFFKKIKTSIKESLISYVNTELPIPVEVGDISVSFVKKFPNITVVFNNVLIKSSHPEIFTEPLLKSEEVSLAFNIVSFLRKNFVFQSISIDNAICNTLIKNSDLNNFTFETKSNNKKTDFDLFENIRRVYLSNFQYYYNEKEVSEARIFVEDLKIANKNSRKKINAIKTKGTVKCDFLKLNSKIIPIPKNNIEFNLPVTYHRNDKKSIELNKAQLSSENIKLFVDGIFSLDDARLFDIKVNSDKLNAKEIINLLPAELASKFEKMTFDGNIKLESSIRGSLENSNNIAFDVKTFTKDLSIKLEDENLLFSNLNFNTDISYNEKGDISFDIKKIKGKIDDLAFEGVFNYNVKNSQKFYLEILSNVDIAKLNSLVKLKDIDFSNGGIDFKILANGDISELNTKSPDFSKMTISGQLSLQDVDFKHKALVKPITNLNANIAVIDNSVFCNHLNLLSNKSDVSYKGVIENAIKFIFDKNAKILIKGSLESENLNFVDFETVSYDTIKSKEIFLPNFFTDIKIKNLHYKKFKATQCNAIFIADEERTLFKTIKAKSLQGNITGDFQILRDKSAEDAIKTNLEFNNIDINELFKATDNFGLEDIKAENIFGTLNGNLDLAFGYKPDNKIDNKSIKAQSKFTLLNGRLLNLKIAEKLSKFIKIDDLKDINFSALENEITIYNGLLTLPRMTIRSSAIDFSLLGTHSIINNDINYHLTLLLSDVLWSKWKRNNKNEDQNNQQDFAKGKSKLYLILTGNMSNPTIKYDKEAAKEKFKNDLKKEEIDLKQALRKEFNWFKNDTNLIKSTENNKSETQKEFEIEWEDE